MKSWILYDYYSFGISWLKMALFYPLEIFCAFQWSSFMFYWTHKGMRRIIIRSWEVSMPWDMCFELHSSSKVGHQYCQGTRPIIACFWHQSQRQDAMQHSFKPWQGTFWWIASKLTHVLLRACPSSFRMLPRFDFVVVCTARYNTIQYNTMFYTARQWQR